MLTSRTWIWCLLGAFFAAGAVAADQPQWGERHSRNMVSTERGLPKSFDVKTGHNVRWSARLGTESYSTPIVAGGKVYIGTNNGEPRDSRHQGDRGVLMCFDERDGRLLWQLVVPKLVEDPFYDWPKSGMSSPATVEGDRVYIVSNRGEVLCLDTTGMSNGNDGPFRDEGAHMTPAGESRIEPAGTDADILWIFDMVSGAGIWPHDAAHSSILIDGDLLYVNTGTGVDNTHKKIRKPDAPSLIVLDKNTGKLLAREREGIGPNIFHCTWSSPSMGTVNGKRLVFFAGGNGVVYAFEPLQPQDTSGEVKTLSKVWSYDCDPGAPKEDVHRYNQNRREGPSNIYGMPVFHDDRIYVAGGGDLFWGKTTAWFQCIKATGTGDVTSNAMVWSYPLRRHTISTPSILNKLAFIADCGRTVHCVDIETAKALWTHETQGDIWASPMVVDGKVYIGTRRGDFWIFAAAREKTVLFSGNVGGPVSATATAANKTLYVATMTHLYALAEEKGDGAPSGETATQKAKEAPLFETTDVFVSGADGYFAYRIPAIETAPDGSLLAFAEARKYNLHDPGFEKQEIDLVMKRSTNNGRAWSPMVTIEDAAERWSAANPATVVDRDTETIWLFYLRGKPGRNTYTARPGTDDVGTFVRHSRDNGHSWSEPIDLTGVTRDMGDSKWRTSVVGPGGGIQSRDGRLALPVWRFEPWGVCAVVSDDHGKNWKRGAFVPGVSGDECQLVELSNGEWLFDIRQQRGAHRWRSTSNDKGESWSKPRPGENVSRVACAIERYTLAGTRDRNRLLWTGPAGPQRSNLVVRVSYDEGATFPHERSIYKGPAAYSDMAILQDHTVGVLWERGTNTNYQFITFTRFNREWLEPVP